MEEENRVFGKNAEAADNNLESEEKVNIYHKDKEIAENNIDISAGELTDFFESLLQDEPEPSEEEVAKGIAEILEKTHPEESKAEPVKHGKSRKVTLRVLFIAAILSVVAFSCLCVAGSSHNISIENGFVTFAKDTVKIIFFGEKKEEYIDVKTLLEDLNSNGYKDVLLPQALYSCKSSLPVYTEGLEGENDKVEFQLSNVDVLYYLRIEKLVPEVLQGNYFIDLDNAETVEIDDIYVYVFEFETGVSCISFAYEGYHYFIQSEASLSDMMNIAQTIIKTEE